MFGVKNGISRRMVPKWTDLAKTLQIPMKTKVGQPEKIGKIVTKSV